MAKIDLKNYKQQTTPQTGEVVAPKIIPTQIPNNETFETSEIEPQYNVYELSKEDSECLKAIDEAKETDYEQYVIDSFEEELSLAEEQIKEQLALQDEKDGLINDLWHGFKEFTGIGVSKRDIKEAIDKQENAINKLKEAKEKGNFAQVYEEITGHKYDEEKLKQCQEAENTLENILNSENPQDFEKEYIEAQSKYKELSNEYLGTSNELTNVLNNYVDSQDSFIDKAANVAQIGGMGMMIVGGIACFIPGGQIIGAGMIKAGQMLAMAGTFGDNALEAVDLMTNDKSFAEEKEEVKELVKETAIDGALFLAGYGAGSVASKLGGKVLEATGSKALSVATDKITDIGLSLASDAAITGEVDLQGEGLSQLLSVLTGSATAKVYGAKINTKLDAFINDKFKLGIGKSEVEIPKIEAQKTEVPEGNTSKFSFNPETGELGTPRVKSEVNPVKLNHTEAGDSAGNNLRMNSASLDTDFSSVDFKKLTPEQKVQIQDCAINLASVYNAQIKGIQETYSEIFGNAKEVTARGKSPKSTLEKLIAKQEKGDLPEITVKKAETLIGDGYGIRVQMQSLTKVQSDSIIQKSLEGTGKTQAQFQKLIDDKKYTELLTDPDFKATFEKLKEARSKDVVESLVQGIKSGQIAPANGKDDYFNNYGSEITSYLTNGQLLKIDEAYFETYGEHLTFVNKTPVETPNTSMDMSPEAASTTNQTNAKKAEKPSGYTDAQFNITTNHTDKNNPLADMELQLRGAEVHKVAEVEHIPYDIRQGKITATNPKYVQYYTLLKGMSPESYSKYNEYLKESYTWATLKELGLTTDAQKPELKAELFYGDSEYLQKAGVDVNLANGKITADELSKITLEGLAKYKVK